MEEVMALGRENLKQLDEEIRRGKLAMKAALEQYKGAKSEINARFDSLSKVLEDTRAESLSTLDSSFAVQEQRLTFELETAKSHRRYASAIMAQAQQTLLLSPKLSAVRAASAAVPSRSLEQGATSTSGRPTQQVAVTPSGPSPRIQSSTALSGLSNSTTVVAAGSGAVSIPRKTSNGSGRQQQQQQQQQQAGPGQSVFAPPDDPDEDASERLAHFRAALEQPVRHLCGVKVVTGTNAAWEQAAKAVRALADVPRVEATSELPDKRTIVNCTALSVSVPRVTFSGVSGLASVERVPERKFVVLSAASEKRALDVCSKLRGAVGRCVVDNVKANETLVSLDELSMYDAAFVWVGGCTSFAGGPALGSVLARYVMSGGGVVVCPWALASDEDGDGLRGEIVDKGILGTFLGECITGTRMVWRNPCTGSSGCKKYASASSLPTDDDQMWDDGQSYCVGSVARHASSGVGQAGGPCHPLMSGVRFIDGGTYSGHHLLRVADDATVECPAQWEDGTPLALLNKSSKQGRYTTAVVNLYPVSCDFSVRGWDTSTDVAVLFANALHIVARRPG